MFTFNPLSPPEEASRAEYTCVAHTKPLPPPPGCILHNLLEARAILSGRVFPMNTIPPQGIGAVSQISEGKAPIPSAGTSLIRTSAPPWDHQRTLHIVLL
jgi:hypothetical protein